MLPEPGNSGFPRPSGSRPLSNTNLSFLVTDGPGRWVIRLNSDIEDSGISRNDELTILKGAHRAGITPPMVFNGQDFLISEY
ncbi:MAG: hypothetical protein CMQ19_03135 [Gammaproteobacteria bacterium]|nr:hypothetical protein [Gammaproteobacteria bacterium]